MTRRRITFPDYWLAVGVKPPRDDLRLGQCAFNDLARIRPDLAEPIRGSDLDPFYDDKRLPFFLGYVAGAWDDPERSADPAAWADAVRHRYRMDEAEPLPWESDARRSAAEAALAELRRARDAGEFNMDERIIFDRMERLAASRPKPDEKRAT